MTYRLLLIFTLGSLPLLAQYAPAAGLPGSDAVAAGDASLLAWAETVSVMRGPQQAGGMSSAPASVGQEIDALGPPDAVALSLGDGGIATISLAVPLRDGPGWDLAVFENGFAAGGGYFLELAFVEVSSDGVRFVRFPAHSLTDSSRQVGTFDLLQPEKIHNLAGKYIAGYGTPFDLADLADSSGLDRGRITHIRIVDVVGSLRDSLASYDSGGRAINDPWPTPFPSGGFDLDAVGWRYPVTTTAVAAYAQQSAPRLWPNPLGRGQAYRLSVAQSGHIRWFDGLGRLLHQEAYNGSGRLIAPALPAGYYVVAVDTAGGQQRFRVYLQ